MRTTVPLSIVAGETVEWKLTLADYPASDGWVLTYILVKDAVQITVTSTASDDDHLISITAAESANFDRGRYKWQSFVSLGTARHHIATGSIEVKPDFETLVGGEDNLDHVRKMLDAIEAVMLGRATNDQQSYSIQGRSLTRMQPNELIKWRSIMTREIRRLEQQERAAAGLKSRRKVLVRLN